ncbi:hypothetical protein PRIPAC_75311, partial [Pristionchus pacificus]|uniref:Uncharacterized protein n=1 Tax=Pristionchus pacificus TaxID=54126 RepID=A0A2A6BG40_PRIPA
MAANVIEVIDVDSDDSGDIAVREAIRKAGEELRKAFDEADELREKDKSDPSSARYSRECPICTTENPREKLHSPSVDTSFASLVQSVATNGKCVFCRKKSAFVKLIETPVS